MIIRVVWNGSKNGVNETMYTPSFQLPTPASYHRVVEPEMEAGDFDIGEQFPNYMLHPTEQPYFGVDLPPELLKELEDAGIEVSGGYLRWTRLPFGWQSSPYLALRMLARALEIACRDPADTTSAFAFCRVEMNLPGSTTYQAGIPRVRRIRIDGLIAVILISYFDDGRVAGPNIYLAEQALRQVVAGIQYLGNQDAARKRRAVSKRPGAWAGSVTYTDQETPRKLLTQLKWDKAKAALSWVAFHIQEESPMDRSKFRSKTGFLNHVVETYDIAAPYMQGFYLSENSWRDNRDPQGYRIRVTESDPKNESDDESEDELFNETQEFLFKLYDEEMMTIDEDDLDLGEQLPPRSSSATQGEPPMVVPVPRLQFDVAAMQKIFAGDTPAQVILRPVRGAYSIVYGGGDASGEGYGTLVTPLGMEPLFQMGFWCCEFSEKSSNWREFRNLLERIRIEANAGRLVAKEVWIATDNSTAEKSFYKGRSSSPELDAMVLELRLIAMRGNFILHLVHVAGTRMIAFGIDGLSRGEKQVGALLHGGVAGILPLHLSASERSPDLKEWLCSWAGSNLKFAEPIDWFYAAQQGGDYSLPQRDETWVWIPAPAAALDALEELGKGRLKRHETLRGVVVVPTLLTCEWYRRFRKNVDVYFTIPAGSLNEWGAREYESLTIGLYLPLLRHRPWDWKRSAFMVSFGRSVSAMYKEGDPSGGNILREFWEASRWLASMPERLVRDLLSHPSWRRFLNISRRRRSV